MLSDAEIKSKIIAIRDKINTYLGRLSPILNEEKDTIIYPSDLGGRHNKLQAIAGRFTFEYNTSISLYTLLNNPALITQLNLLHLIKRLRGMLLTVDGLPPIREKLKDLIEDSIVELIEIRKDMRHARLLNKALRAELY
jgi:hypothetical protein